jgi:hypothetical protein
MRFVALRLPSKSKVASGADLTLRTTSFSAYGSDYLNI